jgi:predicted porin
MRSHLEEIAMKKITTFRRATMGAAVAAALAAAPGAHALEAAVSGHVNRLITQVDDGVDSDLFHADNINSQTRFRFTGIHEVSPGLKAGIVWEMGFTSNPSNSISFTNRTVAATLNERHVDAFLQGGWGKLSMGQGDGAANGGMEVDLSGTTVIQYSGVADIGGGFAFRNGTAFGPTIASTIDNLDFESRYDRVRYDTPKFGPVSLAASYGVKGNNNVGEAALWFSGDAGSAGRIAGALGYSNEELPGVAGNEQIFGGSVSWLLPAGFNLTVGYGNSEDDTPGRSKKKFSYAKAGYKGTMHAVSVDFGKGEDIGANGDEADVVGIGYVYTPQKWIELYAGVKRHSLDRPGLSLDDVSFVTAGTRIKF